MPAAILTDEAWSAGDRARMIWIARAAEVGKNAAAPSTAGNVENFDISGVSARIRDIEVSEKRSGRMMRDFEGSDLRCVPYPGVLPQHNDEGDLCCCLCRTVRGGVFCQLPRFLPAWLARRVHATRVVAVRHRNTTRVPRLPAFLSGRNPSEVTKRLTWTMSDGKTLFPG